MDRIEIDIIPKLADQNLREITEQLTRPFTELFTGRSHFQDLADKMAAALHKSTQELSKEAQAILAGGGSAEVLNALKLQVAKETAELEKLKDAVAHPFKTALVDSMKNLPELRMAMDTANRGGKVGGLIGAGLGAMTGVSGLGPMGEIVGMVLAGTGQISKLFDSLLKGIAGGIQDIAMLGPAAFKSIADSVTIVGSIGVTAFKSFTDSVANFAKGVGGADFVKMSNPGVIEQLNLALDDMSGIIGQALTPIMQAIIPMVRDFGDFIASILPSQQSVNELMEKLNPLFEMMHNALVALSEALEPVVEAFMEFMGFLADNWEIVVVAFAGLIGVLVALGIQLVVATLSAIGFTGAVVTLAASMSFGISLLGAAAGVAAGVATVAALKSATGVGGERKEFKEHAMGAAAHGAQFVGVEALGKNMILAALNQGANPQVKTAKHAERIQQILEQNMSSGREAPSDNIDGNYA